MWSELYKYSAQFKSAVLTGVNADGYPYSVRCTPTFDEFRFALYIGLANELAIEPGRASLLYHQHNEQLWDLKMFLVRGFLEYDTERWVFYPGQLILGNGLRHPLHDIAAIMRMRRAAKQYLHRRGLERPSIPWAEIKALYP